MNTMQQEFDAVCQHLYRQGRPALEDAACKYRTKDGLMCAVGCRIPDEMYKPEMDWGGSTGLREVIYKHKFPNVIMAYREMFQHLQVVHDCWLGEYDGTYSFQRIAPLLEACAKSFGLTYNAPDKA